VRNDSDQRGPAVFKTCLKKLNRSKGVTLVELMVATGLASALFFALASVYILMDSSWDRGTSLLNLQRDGSYAVVELASAVRMGSAMEAAPATTLTIKDVNDSTLAQYYFQASDSTLRDIAGARVIPSRVDSLSFSLSGQTVAIALVLTDAQDQKAFFNTSASLRN